MDPVLDPPLPAERTATVLPLVFCPPPGWPEPSPDWCASHQGWLPAADWSPLPGLPAAPAGWSWWEQDPAAWSEFAGRGARAFWTDVATTVFLALVGVLGVVVSLKAGSDLAMLFAGLAVFGPLNLLRLVGRALTAEERALRRLRDRSARLGDALAVLAYDERRPVWAGRGLTPPPFDDFLVEREHDAWASAGSWSDDQWHPDLRAIFDRYCRRRTSPCHRLALAALAGLSGGGLLITALVMLAGRVTGSGSQ